MHTKRCSTCQQMKTLENFSKCKSRSDGLYPICKECHKESRIKKHEQLKEHGFKYVTEKLCTNCKTIKPREAFGRDSYKTTGLQNFCRDCSSKVYNNYLKDPENKKKRSEYNKEWVQNNKDKVQKIRRKYIENGYIVPEKKTCFNCKVEKLISEFVNHKYAKDGKTSNCRICHNEISRKKRQDPEFRKKEAERRKKYRAEHPEVAKAYYENNKEHILQQCEEYRLANPEKVSEAKKQARLKKIDHYKAKTLQNKKAVKRATPKWLTEEQRQDIVDFYKNRPEGYEVDHIYPINGEDVCCLHVPWNLQYLPAPVNSAKQNRILSEEELNELVKKHEKRCIL